MFDNLFPHVNPVTQEKLYKSSTVTKNIIQLNESQSFKSIFILKFSKSFWWKFQKKISI